MGEKQNPSLPLSTREFRIGKFVCLLWHEPETHDLVGTYAPWQVLSTK